jgi:Zn-dependent protease with chaperone function
MKTRTRRRHGKNSTVLLVLALLVLVPGAGWAIERLSFRPGFNLFSPTQDVQVGRDAAKEADHKLPLLNDSQVTDYVNALGRRLSAYAPNNNSDYVWQFKVVNSPDINAFALPGGFIYVNRGAIEAAENEAQIAGVIAHEEGHVVMRHGTHRASEAMLAQAPLTILGDILGQASSLPARLAELGIGVGVNTLFLKNSRDAESQADEVGTYILYNAGYDPHAMARFFQIIEQKYPQQTIQFFSDHPNPANRIQKVDEEIPQLGDRRNWKTDSPEFGAIKSRLAQLSPAPKPKPVPQTSSSADPPPRPSDRMVKYEATGFAINYPDNWQIEKSEDNVALLPPGGAVTGPGGESNQAYGVSISRFQPQNRSTQGWGLIDATNELVENIRQSNPNMRVLKQGPLKLSGQPALTTLLQNDSPIQGQKERDNLVTLRLADALLSVIFIAPEASVELYNSTFDAMLKSLEVR